MALTEANFSANLVTAKRIVAQQLGVDPANLSYEDRTRYNKALANYILQYPQSFSSQTLANAQAVSAKDYENLQDASFDWGEFISETGTNAVPVLEKFTNKLLVVGAVALVAYIVVKYLPGSLAGAKSAANAK